MSTNKKVEILESFLHILKGIVKEIVEHIPDDPKIYRIHKRIMLAIDYHPEFTFNKVGSYLYKYRNFIYDSSTEDLLLQWDFVEAYNKKDKEVEDVSLLIISELKRHMMLMNKEQKDYYRQMVVDLLDNYIEYTCPE